jgi:hypothetical protein
MAGEALVLRVEEEGEWMQGGKAGTREKGVQGREEEVQEREEEDLGMIRIHD